MPTDAMFEWLKDYDKIVVTGPQRSGTRICAKMIAHDTGHTYVDESRIGLDSLYSLWSLLHRREEIVVHCPALCRHAHTIAAVRTAIVLMRRRVADIIASQERIGWQWEEVELARYDRSEGVIAKVKYRFWEEHQKDQIDHAFEVAYESLSRHPLWVTESLRRDFKAAQTSL